MSRERLFRILKESILPEKIEIVEVY
jgi:hypothetical protein